MEEEIRDTESENVSETSENAEEAENINNEESETVKEENLPEEEIISQPENLNNTVDNENHEWPEVDYSRQQTVKETLKEEKKDIEMKFEDIREKKTVTEENKPQKKKSGPLLLCLWLALTTALCGVTGFLASKAGYNKAYAQLNNE